MFFKLKRKDNVLRVDMKYKANSKNFNFLFCSDIHIDNPKCKKERFIDDLKRIQDKEGGFIIFGDFFCLMQGRNDRRGQKSAIGDFAKEDYFDAVIQYGKDVLMPFKENLICITDGNHETSVVKNMEINPLKMLIRDLGLNPEVSHLPYLGYIDFVFTHESGGNIKKQKIFYDHGGYHGEVSKGSLSIQRYAAMSVDADIICSGDTHHRWINTHHQYKVDSNGGMQIKEQLHLKCGTYKEEFGKGGGWAVEKIKFPKGIGGLFLELEVNDVVKRRVTLES